MKWNNSCPKSSTTEQEIKTCFLLFYTQKRKKYFILGRETGLNNPLHYVDVDGIIIKAEQDEVKKIGMKHMSFL